MGELNLCKLIQQGKKTLGGQSNCIVLVHYKTVVFTQEILMPPAERRDDSQYTNPSGDKMVLTGTAILASCLCMRISNTGRKDFELLT